MGDVPAIKAAPAIRIARPAPMQLVHPGAPAVECEIYPITFVGPQRDVFLHRRYLSAPKITCSGHHALGCLCAKPFATILFNSMQSGCVNHFDAAQARRISDPRGNDTCVSLLWHCLSLDAVELHVTTCCQKNTADSAPEPAVFAIFLLPWNYSAPNRPGCRPPT